MFDFRRGERLREYIGYHVAGRTENEAELAVVDDPADEMETHVYVLGMGMVLVVLGCNAV